MIKKLVSIPIGQKLKRDWINSKSEFQQKEKMKMKTNKVHTGDLIATKDTEIDFDEITGSLKIEKGIKFVAKKLKKVGGYLSINSNAELDAPKLETVGGYLSIYSNAALPKLETVGGYLSIYSNAALPKLETVGGDLYINSNAALPKLETVGGYLSINSDAELDAPKLETVGGYLSIYSNAALPKLETVGGDLSIYSNAALPKLETVGGDLYINSNAALPKLETVGGDLSIYSNAALPKLETVGGYLSINSDAELDAPKLVNKNDATAKPKCGAALALSFKKKGFLKIDGILSWFVSKRKIKNLIVFKVQIVGKLNISFVVQRNNSFSHGETVEKAIESLRYKLTDRDTERFKKWKLTTKVSVEDAIQAYRAITGACEFGVKNFCESIEVPKELTVSRVIKLTQGKYGNDTFQKFFG